mmetsp:Transcript_48799/g.77761  ORF Transcript_48799/g.77761 Transcript_48799/m.77761 type:complete len:823 (-) Transcript_48799:127-2595(-)
MLDGEGISAIAHEFDGPSYITSASRNEAVVLRCRDTNLRLYSELEEEKGRKKQLQQQMLTLESELKATKAELQKERTQKAETEARVSRLERRAADAEAQLLTQKQGRETTGEQLQKLKAETIQKGQDIFERDLRISELEGAVQRAEARASAAESEATRVMQELGAASERLAKAESEVAQLRINVTAEAAKADRATQLCEERDKSIQTLRREIDSAQTSEEASRAQLAENRKRQENLVAACREREAELRRSLTERHADAEQSSLHLNTEVSDLRGQLQDLEMESSKHERLVAQLRSELATAQIQQQSVQADNARTSDALSAKCADFAKVQVEFEATEQQVQRLSETLKNERKVAQERFQAINAEKDKLQEKSHRDALTGSESLQQQVENGRRLSEELKAMQEKMTAMTREKEKLMTDIGNLQQQARNHQQEMTKHKTDKAELEHLLETRATQHAAHGALLDQRVSATLAECSAKQSLWEHQKSDLEKSQEKVMQDYQEAHAQAAELTWRLDATNKELERSREALKIEHERAKKTKEVAQQTRQSLGHAEGEASKASELYMHAQRQSAELKKELEQAHYALEQVRGKHLEESRTSTRLEVKAQEMGAQAAQLALSHAETVSRMQASIDVAEAQVEKEKRNADMAESRAEGLFIERLRNSEAAANSKLRDVELAAQERLQAAELTAATKIKEISTKLRETEDSHVAQAAAASAAFRAREAEVEVAAAKLSETRLEESKTKYEQKLSKLYRQLSERQAYEHKLKSVLKNEVDLLHEHDQELDAVNRGKQSKKVDRHLVEDFIADRMKGMAEKVERRVLRSLRHPQR